AKLVGGLPSGRAECFSFGCVSLYSVNTAVPDGEDAGDPPRSRRGTIGARYDRCAAEDPLAEVTQLRRLGAQIREPAEKIVGIRAEPGVSVIARSWRRPESCRHQLDVRMSEPDPFIDVPSIPRVEVPCQDCEI